MARSIWSGYITFGLVSVPVSLFSATKEHEVDFHQFQRGTSDRIRYKRVNERTGREVDYDKVLMLHTMFYSDEVRDPKREIGKLPVKISSRDQLSMAVDLVEAMSGAWRPADYRDTYTDRVKKLVQTKRRGKEVVVTEEEPEPTNVTDLVAALRASVEEARTKRRGKGSPKKSKKRRAA